VPGLGLWLGLGGAVSDGLPAPQQGRAV